MPNRNHKVLRTLCERYAQQDSLLRWGTKFVDLEECSEKYQQAFKNAWKAIKHGSLRKLKDSIENMKKHSGTCPGDQGYLDVCYLQHEMSLSERKRTFYYMGLLAHAAICGQKDLVEELIRSNAKPDVGDCLSGLPLTQILVYALHHNCPEVVKGEILQLLICTNLNINIVHYICDDVHDSAWCSPIELAITIKRIDIAQQLVMAGADPIHPTLENISGVLQLLDEYYELGTNKYLSWLLYEHLLSHEIPPFVETVVKLNIFNKSGMRMFNEVGRHPAHALLTCGNEEMVQQLLQHHKEIKVNVKDGSGRTALQIATEKGDLESVKILLKFYRKLRGSFAGSDNEDGSDDDDNDGDDSYLENHVKMLNLTEEGESQKTTEDKPSKTRLSAPATAEVDIVDDEDWTDYGHEMSDLRLSTKKDDKEKSKSSQGKDTTEIIDEDLETALLIAARKGDIKIVRCILEENILIVFSIMNQAVEEGLTSLFEVLRDYQFIYWLLTAGNNLVHIAAATGNAKLFKVFFPLQVTKEVRSFKHHRGKSADLQKFQKMISTDNAREMFEALTLDDNDKTPLHLAIDNNHICIMKTLQERIIERESHPGAEQNKEKNAWEIFWKEWGPKLFIYACSNGTVEMVKFFIEMEQENEERDGSLLKKADADGDTPVCAAARSGNDNILLYLLEDCKLSIPQHSWRAPLLLAAENGHATCVSILLKKGADITETNEDGYNCLMIATERKHSHTVMVILSDKKGFEALRCRKGSITPMRLLIKHLPDAAEWILNRCVLEKHKVKKPLSGGSGIEEVDGSVNSTECGLLNEFEFLEDFRHHTETATKTHDEIDLGGDFEDDEDSEHSVRTQDWRLEKYHSSKHTIKLMVKYNRERLLRQVLVKRLIQYKWWRVGFPILLISYGFHLTFLILLTAFALVLPTAGPGCATNMIGVVNNTTSSPGNGSCEQYGVNENERQFLTASSVIIILICGFYLLLEAFQMLKRKPKKYFSDPQNYFQVVTYCCVIVFVFPLGHTCWCYPSWKWQIGALALFLVWTNNLVLLKHIPHVGNPITMLFNVYVNFIKLFYLPVLLILTFAFPFYMLFVASMEGVSEILFPTPFHAMWSVILQTADGPDAEFFSNSLSHRIMTYILFITFIVAVPILFNNFLIGMAVGETEKERNKAKLSLIKAKVDYIFESEDSIPFFRRCCYGLRPKLNISTHKLELLEQQNKSVLEGLKLEGDVLKNSKKFDKLQREMTGTVKSLDALEGKMKQVFNVVQELQDNVTKNI